MKRLRSIFINGVKVTFPFLLTLFFIYWLFFGIEKFLASFLLLFIDKSSYFTGLGWIFLILLIFLIGLFMKVSLIEKIQKYIQRQVVRLPFVKIFYNTSTNLATLVREGEVVSFKTPIGKLIGIVTHKNLNLADFAGKDDVAVYVQMSYNIGGYTFIVPKDAIEPVDISVQDAMTLTLTAFVSDEQEEMASKKESKIKTAESIKPVEEK